ncbi:TonB-dependent siderophore receptor [Pseudomonas sp. Bout1]|uniref:TonB-dependent siderophore receptor n=1 Tax=Pseudomonas sp. Bout1 TaxID=3048600 RepID=UPI002AB3ABDF|nr:TonB-dependent siderophore receptor [Pseudomonas sp. Bout1]MDY7535655.1 TonB-dependent siderophore receptor [Pseudomonas sp. Bout1]MEB0185603.1 TonB-dependent siderophore receptor [Pseudomonas sp. Bout1]
MPYSPFTGFKRLPLAIALLGAGALQPIAVAQAVEAKTTEANAQRFNFDIAAQTLADALDQFALQSGYQVLYDAGQAKGLRSAELHGQLTAQQALNVLTRGTQAVYTQPNASSFVIDIPASTGSPLQLSPVSISGKAPGSTTEHTGSYTTQSSSSSTRLNIPLKETPQSVTVITQQRMEDQRLSNLTDALEATSGITVVREGLGADSDAYYSRGFQINNYEIDGVPTSSKMDNYTQNTAMYDRVEVVRGATGLISGMGQPSATINLIRKRPTDTAQATIRGEAGSWDRYGTSVDVSGPLTDTGNIRGRLVLDYKNQHSWVDRYKQDSDLVYGITEFDLSESTLLTAGFSYLTVHTDAPPRSGFPLFYGDGQRSTNGQRTDFKRSYNTATNWSFYDHDQSSFFTSLEQQFDNGWSAKVEFSHTENKYDSTIDYLSGPIDQTTGLGGVVVPNKFKGNPKQNAIDAYVTGPFELFGREHELIAGINLSQIRNTNAPDYGGWMRGWTGYEGAVGPIYDWNGSSNTPNFVKKGEQDFKENQYAGYITSRWHLNDDTSLILGSRVIDWKQTDETRYTDPDYTDISIKRKENGVVIPYAGIVYDLSEVWAVYASYTKIFNPQSEQTVTGSYLEPLEGTGYELGVKASLNDDKLNASLALFKLEQDNLPQADIGALTPAGWQAYTAAQGTTTEGVELELNGELAQDWNIAGGYTYSVSRNADDQRISAQIPRHSLKMFTTYRLSGPLDKLTVGGGFNWQSKTGFDLRYYTQESYAVANLMARYEITKNLSATVNLNNVFDKEYFTTTSAGVYGAPRNLMTGFKYDF